MKQLTCEMCGSTDLVKQDGYFVCQTCGTKYSVEEAKKMMIEGTVEVQGTVKVENVAQIDSLLKLANSSFDSHNYAQAENFCNQIIAIDDKNYEAWKLKGEAINYQISASNPRILEVFNCIMTSYRVLDDEGKEEHEADILVSIKTCFEGEIDFWLDQLDSTRPTESAINKVKSTFNDSISKITSAFIEMGLGEYVDEYKTKLTNYFITKVSVKCVSLWKTTVGYNYYRESFDKNNHTFDSNTNTSDKQVIWVDDDYRPSDEILRTFLSECDNLINLLLFTTTLFNAETNHKTIINVYENVIFLNSHAILSESFNRMVSTTTNQYGAVTDKHEYWKSSKSLTSKAIDIRTKNNEKYRESILELVPEYKKTFLEYKKTFLEGKLKSLDETISSIVTERHLRQPIGGAVWMLIGIISVFTSILCGTTGGDAELTAFFLVFGLIGIMAGVYGFTLHPSKDVIKTNVAKREELIKERNKIQKEVDSLE